MKHPERVADYLAHIAEASGRATSYVQPLQDIHEFEQNQQIQDAVVRNIQIIGEAATQINRMAPEFITQHPELPWSEMRRMRNIVVHSYFAVNLQILWQTVTADLPKLKQQVDHLLTPPTPQPNLSLAERFGKPVTREAEPGADHERDDDREP